MIKYFKSLFTSAKPGHRKPKVLFLLKLRDKIPGYSYGSSGLYNSARFVNEMLRNHGFESCLEQVVDANSIDREVHKLKPDVVVIEAFWVTPAKFKELKKLHPGVRWIVRNHSKPAFLAQEGSAFGWILEYFEQGIEVASNSYQGVEGLASLAESRGLDRELSTYLPNYYPLNPEILGPRDRARPKSVNIGCFGGDPTPEESRQSGPGRHRIRRPSAADPTLPRQRGSGRTRGLRLKITEGHLRRRPPSFWSTTPWYDHTSSSWLSSPTWTSSPRSSHSESFCCRGRGLPSAKTSPWSGVQRLEWLQGFP